MKRLLVSLGGAALALFAATSIALAAEPIKCETLTSWIGTDRLLPTWPGTPLGCGEPTGEKKYESSPDTDARSGDAEGGDVEQEADQDNDTEQKADADASAIQVGGVNLAANVLNHGDTEQGIENENEAEAENSNETVQVISQDQDADGGDADSGDAVAFRLPLLG